VTDLYLLIAAAVALPVLFEQIRKIFGYPNQTN
jgi:hypothetical protein